MNDLADYALKLDKLIKEIAENTTRQANIMAVNQLALLKDRVIETNKKSDGSDTGEYSETLLPTFFYKNAVTRKGSAYEDLKEGVERGVYGEIIEDAKGNKGYYASYKDWREVNNLPVEAKTYSFTGRMWQSIKTVLVLEGFGRAVFNYQSSGDEAKKLGYVLLMEPTLLDATEAEKEIASESTRVFMSNLIIKNLS